MAGVTEPATRETPEAREAVERLVAEHGGTLYGLGLRICGSPQAAEDMVQETFLNAYRGWKGFEGRSEVTTWLYTIARRACTRMHRPRAGEPSHMEPVEELAEVLPGEDDAVADLSRVDPYSETVRREARERVDRALAELPPDFRMALVLVDLAELSIAEVARVLGVPENTVKTRVHRARLRLRTAVEEGLPRRHVAADGERNACLAMLQAKQEALDRGVELAIPGDTLCERCRAVFTTLDLSKDACRSIREGGLPETVREHLRAMLDAESAAS